jgi:hypothetical protein
MPNQKLGALAKQEIRDSLRGLVGSKATAEIERLANFYDCSKSQIYTLSREVRPARKARNDKGKKTGDIFTNETLNRAAQFVALHNLRPDLALEMAELNTGEEISVSLATFRRRLREWGLNRRMRRRMSRAYRAFEAEAPMDIFQFDISGVKQRWVDLRTRRIYQVSVLDESRNHPYDHPSRVRLWKFSLIDDRSRRRLIRFIACDKPNSTHCIEFFLEAFREMGIPRLLYTDRDAIIISERTTRAGQILNRLFEDDGGFRMEQHRAGNPQATGKVERTHQVVEEYEPLIGLYEKSLSQLGEYGAMLDRLNDFAREMCDKLNWSKHRATGEAPMLRWNATHQPLRIPPPAVLDAIFTADEFIVPVAGDVTVSFGGARYQLPRTADFPFREYAEAGSKIKVVQMKGAPTFFVAAADGSLFEIEKTEAKPDTAGEFKSLPVAKRARAVKELRASDKAQKQKHKEAGTRDLVPGVDVPFKKSDRPTPMPKARNEADTSRLAEVAPAAAAFIEGRFINRFDAILQFQQEGYFTNPISGVDREWLLALYGDREEMLDAEIRSALDVRPATRKTA